MVTVSAFSKVLIKVFKLFYFKALCFFASKVWREHTHPQLCGSLYVWMKTMRKHSIRFPRLWNIGTLFQSSEFHEFHADHFVAGLNFLCIRTSRGLQRLHNTWYGHAILQKIRSNKIWSYTFHLYFWKL